MTQLPPPFRPDKDFEAVVKRQPWLEFQPQFNAGHVLQAIVVVSSMIVAFAMIQARQDQQEKELLNMARTMEQKQQVNSEALKEIKIDFIRSFSSLERALERISDKLDKKADK